MKTLHVGKKKEDEKWIGKCNDCGSIVEAETHELNAISPGDYRSDLEDFAWEKCHECGASRGICFHRSGTESAKSDLASR